MKKNADWGYEKTKPKQTQFQRPISAPEKWQENKAVMIAYRRHEYDGSISPGATHILPHLKIISCKDLTTRGLKGNIKFSGNLSVIQMLPKLEECSKSVVIQYSIDGGLLS